MQQTLRRPVNWQDFEELCKRLWGEIWNCPEIVRHGRQGQSQWGVDVYGIPEGKESYYGIQCKGKDEYTNQQFTEKEIDKEIEKARLFDPPLAMYYLATTAVKDAKIEAYVRKKNIELRESGLFGIALYSWEDIVDLIDENRRTHDYYVRGQKYKALKSADITFEGGLTEITLQPQFEKRITIYREKAVPASAISQDYTLSGLGAAIAAANRLQAIVSPISISSPRAKCNLSYVKFNILIRNSGIDSLEDYRIRFQIEGEVHDMTYSNVDYSAAILRITSLENRDIVLNEKSMSGVFTPHRARLVGKDSYMSDDIYIKTAPQDADLILNWELLAKEYNTQGSLLIHIRPEIRNITNEILTTDSSLLSKRYYEEEIKDMIIEEEPDK